MSRMRRFLHPDRLAVLVLFALWLLFFWRLFTPVEADQASLKKGDFSGQFVAFAAYQYQRFSQGEVPLWNPYNNGGLPFIGDTQAAVFYPPRLLTIALSRLAGGWTYHALELEMAVHVLACSLLMYLLVRRMTLGQPGSPFGAFVAAVIASYSGFLQSYPPLQLALLEAAIWLPLAVLGIHEATRDSQVRWSWLVLTGFAYGMSWMAGHPQTTWFLTYLLMAYLGHRVYIRRYRWWLFIAGAALFGFIGGGLAAVQLLPGIEYLAHTARTGLGFDAKGNGFPFQDVVQFIFPGIVSQWSPLYVGIIGLALALIALWRRLPGSLFWGIVIIIALGLSFGANSPVYAFLYNPLPGLRFFRGQERAAFLIAFSLAILAGMGAAHLISWDRLQDFKATRRIQQALIGLVVICGVVTGLILALWLGNKDIYASFISPVAFSLIVSVLALLLIPHFLNNPRQPLRYGLVTALLIFELFTVSMDRDSNYDSIPPQQQLDFSPPPLIETALAEPGLFRVDGYRGLHDNYGSLYGLADMRGISPLFLQGPNAIINPDLINPRAWELFSVRFVYTDWDELPVKSDIVATGEDRYGKVNLHRLLDSRPFALLLKDYVIADSDQTAYALLADPNFDARRTIILNRDPGIMSSKSAPVSPPAEISDFKPESFSITFNAPQEGILSVSNPDYPGWQATLDGNPVEILRAYGALAAVVVPAGEHTVQFAYDPLSYRVGGMVSIMTWLIVGTSSIVVTWQTRRGHATN